MSLIPSNNSSNRSNEVPVNWPNSQTAITSTSVVVNVACKAMNSSKHWTVGLNVPVRVFSVIRSINHKKYYKVAFDAAAFASLFFQPYGIFAAIGFDFISEGINFYLERYSCDDPSQSSNLKRLDPTKIENACKILDIPENRLDDLDFIKINYNRIIDSLEKRKAKLSKNLANEIQLMIDDVHVSYETLTNY